MSKKPENDNKCFVSNDVSLNLSPERKPVVAVLSSWLSKRYLVVIALLILLSVLYIVVFTLPKNVQLPQQVNTEDFIKEEMKKPINVSPWQEAQLAKNRKSAQDILSKVLKKQKILEDKQVKIWAKEDFLDAISVAESGDVHYRLQEFEQALNNYQLTLKQLQLIEDRLESTFNQYYQSGVIALEESNQQLAISELTVALNIKPDDEQALIAIKRSEVLQDVIKFVDKSTVLIAEQQFDAAKDKLLQAKKIDGRSALVKQQLNLVNEKIIERNYSRSMSQGYMHLNKQEYTQALQYFSTAKKIKPTVTDPTKAITETKNKQKQSIIALKTQQAKKDELTESWPKAIVLYEQILALDNTLMSARIGLIRTQSRDKLDIELNNIINQPQRLTNSGVYLQATKTLKDAKQIKNTKSKLNQQITSISRLLQQLTIPIPLFITSDNQTQVTLNRFGELGNFTNKELQLKPGEYTFVGSRNGYRDVRHKVTIMPNSPQHTIEISCREKVSNG
ncbi:MAG: hypothetical protein HRT52_09970 [Colwellia sp.]|nr:hypothetical protein [Colwellia sp.]